jgi:hypothetical protein
VILGRPQNVALGAATAIFNVVALILASQGHPIEPTLYAGINLALAAIIAFVAYQPPTLNPGQTFNVTTPAGQPAYQTVVATPPAADAPPVAGVTKKP